jgi:hypothetical protein
MKYFAAQETKECVTELNRRIDDYYTFIRTTGALTRWRNNYSHYYKAKFTLGRVNKTGEEQEYKAIVANHFRNIISHMVVQTVQNRIKWDARAINNDIESLSQAKLANQLCDAEVKQKKLEDLFRTAVEYNYLYGEGFTKTSWSDTAGDLYVAGEVDKTDENGQPLVSYEIDPVTGEQIPIQETETVIKRQGDVVYSVHSPDNVIRDVNARSFQDCEWVVVRHKKNKFNLIALFPEFEDEIMAVTLDRKRDEIAVPYIFEKTESDYIYVYEFFHKDTDAVQGGRYTLFLNNTTILMDSDLKSPVFPVVRMAGENELHSPFGYTIANDLAALQDALNKLYSIIVTNQTRFGVGVIAVPKGSNISTSTLAKGMKVIEYDPKLGIPTALNFTQTPAEVFTMVDLLKVDQQVITAVNGVQRGQPDPNMRSGTMLELIVSQSYNFHRGTEQSYNSAVETVGTNFIKIMQKYATTERPMQYAGKANRYILKYWKSDSISKVDRIFIEQGNPVQNTLGGKLSIANNLLANGLIKDPRTYLAIIETGNLDVAIDQDIHDVLLMEEETEMLAAGQPVMVDITDYHYMHGLKHTRAISNPEARSNQQVMAVYTEHMGNHALAAGHMLPDGTPDILGFINAARNILTPPPQMGMNMTPTNLQETTDGSQPGSPIPTDTGGQ